MITLSDINHKLSPTVSFENFNWTIQPGENWLISGKCGSGKTSVLKLLAGMLYGFKGTISHDVNNQPVKGTFELKKHTAFVFFKDHHIHYQDFYYQQRYNSSEVEGTFTVQDYLFNGEKPHHRQFLKELSVKLNITHLLNREFIKLSNGETRKIFIVKALLKDPKVLFLDNPYSGIDGPGRVIVNKLINRIATEGIQVIMVGSPKECPSCITHILELENGKVKYKGEIREIVSGTLSTIKPPPNLTFKEIPLQDFEIAFKFSNLTVRYGKKSILDQLNWTVKEGEKWVLKGNNGSGKSMLMSLIFADHPQAYANEIVLFGNKRGKGSSIWEIKEKIAYVSPEMHRYFNPVKTVEEVFGSVFQENPYRKRTSTEIDRENTMNMLSYFGKNHLYNEKFGVISAGEQRLVLLLRALIKNAPLLLLDEPFQDFDAEMIEKGKLLLSSIAKNRTLVLITHHEEEIPEGITHVAELKEGRIDL